jgi:hypothetical protein
MTTLRPDGIYYAGDYKVRLDSATLLWLVIHRPSGKVLSTHDERDHAVAEADRLAKADKAARRKAG